VADPHGGIYWSLTCGRKVERCDPIPEMAGKPIDGPDADDGIPDHPGKTYVAAARATENAARFCRLFSRGASRRSLRGRTCQSSCSWNRVRAVRSRAWECGLRAFVPYSTFSTEQGFRASSAKVWRFGQRPSFARSQLTFC